MLMAKFSDAGIKQFVAKAAEELAALDAEDYFRTRIARADLAAFNRIMSSAGGEPAREGMSVRDLICYIFKSCLRLYLLAFRLK